MGKSKPQKGSEDGQITCAASAGAPLHISNDANTSSRLVFPARHVPSKSSGDGKQ